MPSKTQTQLIAHTARCKRPVPILRLSWRQQPELFCPGCGRATALPVPALVDLDMTPSTTTDKETR